MDTLGWRDIGYHFGIERVGDDYETIIGRSADVVGAHTRSHNHTIGICFVGNFDDHRPPAEQWIKGLTLVRWLLDIYDLKDSDIYGHCDFSAKSCPGRQFGMKQFKAAL